MQIFVDRKMLEDNNKVGELRNQLLVALNKQEEKKQGIADIERELKARKYRVTCAEDEMNKHFRNFALLPESEAPPKSNMYYWRGIEAHNELEAAKAALTEWEGNEVPKIEDKRFWVSELDAKIERLQKKLREFVMIEVPYQEIPEPVFDNRNKRYSMPEVN